MMRWLKAISSLLILSFTSQAYAADGAYDRTSPCGFQELTVSSAATGITVPSACSSGIQFAKKAMCSISGASVRMRMDGTDPDTDTGHVVVDGSFIYLNNPKDIADVSLIRDASTDAEVTCTYRN